MKNLQELSNKEKIGYGIASLVVLGGIGTGIYFGCHALSNDSISSIYSNQNESSTDSIASVTEAIEANPLGGILGSTVATTEENLSKEETVYVIADNTGVQQQVIVSSHLLNTAGAETLNDVSELENIVNVKGNETFTQDGTALVWQANGSDIYYQGTTEKELPVTQNITYYLDGQVITPEELAGQSGHVTIHFDYQNHAKTSAIIDGTEEEVYVPFAAISGVMLDDSFTNIEVVNGRVVSDGEHSIAIGYALPGLKESLKVDTDDFDTELKFPEYFEISADVTNFSLEATMTMVVDASKYMNTTNGIDLTNVDTALNSLEDATTQLQDGTSELAEGVDTIQEKLGDFSAGVTTLQDGLISYTEAVNQVYLGVSDLQSGLSTVSGNMPTLLSGVDDLKEGADSAVIGANNLADGAKQVSDGVNTLASTINGMSTTIENSKNGVYQNFITEAGMTYDAAGNVITSLKSAQDNLKTEIGFEVQGAAWLANGGTVTDTEYLTYMGYASQYYQGVCTSLQQSGITISVTNASDAASAIEFLGGKIAELENGKGKVEGAITALNSVAGNLGNQDTTNKLTSLQDGAKKVYEGAQTLASGLSTLSSGIGTLYQSCTELSNGIAALSNGANTLQNGCATLDASSDEVLDGMQTILNATGQLADGIDTLDNGAHSLENGVISLNQDGIEEMMNTYNGDVKELTDRCDAIYNAGNEYESYTGIVEGQEGSVRIIYRTDGIKAN